MTIEEVCKKYIISIDTLEEYEANGLLTTNINNSGEKEYSEEDFGRLGLVRVLLDSGFTFDETKRYLKLTKELGKDYEQIRILRKQRRELLDNIRAKQKLLDQLDFIIMETNMQLK